MLPTCGESSGDEGAGDDDEPPNCDSNSQAQVSMGDVAAMSSDTTTKAPLFVKNSTIDNRSLQLMAATQVKH